MSNTHDFRRQCWGNALHGPKFTYRRFGLLRKKRPVMSASCHTPRRMEVGDTVIHASQGGDDVYTEVIEVEGRRDPIDMYFFTAVLRERVPSK